MGGVNASNHESVINSSARTHRAYHSLPKPSAQGTGIESNN
jgi:hypothetical protein